MTTLAGLFVALALLTTPHATRHAPRATTVTTADFCSACVDADVPELIAPWRAPLRPHALAWHRHATRRSVAKERV